MSYGDFYFIRTAWGNDKIPSLFVCCASYKSL